MRAPVAAVTGNAVTPGFESRFERAVIVAEKLDDVPSLFASHYEQFLYYYATGKLRRAREFAERMQSLALRQGDRMMRLRAHHVMGSSLFHGGDLPAAQREIEHALTLYDPSRDSNLFVGSSGLLSWVLGISGYPGRAAKVQPSSQLRG